jgi:GH18 family chitinase
MAAGGSVGNFPNTGGSSGTSGGFSGNGTGGSATTGTSGSGGSSSGTGGTGGSGGTAGSAGSGPVGVGGMPGLKGGKRVGYLLIRPGDLQQDNYPTDEQVQQLTHINIAFFTISKGSQGYTVTHEFDSQKLHTFLTKLRQRANKFGVKLIPSIGGWAYGNPTAKGFCNYVGAASTPETRAQFVSEAGKVLDNMCDNSGKPCFDGFDLDVEYIGQRVEAAGQACQDGGGTVQQIPDFDRAKNFMELLKKLKEHFPSVSIAGPGALYSLKFSWSIMKELSQAIDFINVMAYDYNGTWTENYKTINTSAPGCSANAHQCWGCTVTHAGPLTDHHSPLHASTGAPGNYNFLCDANEAIPNQVVCDKWGSGSLEWDSEAGQSVCVNPYVLSADRVIDFYTKGMGVDPSKLVLGVGFYGRSMRNVGPLGGQQAPDNHSGLRQYFGGMCMNENYCWGEGSMQPGTCLGVNGPQSCTGGASYYWLSDFKAEGEKPDPRAVTYKQIIDVCPEAANLDGIHSMSDPTSSKSCGTTGWKVFYDEQAEVPWLYHAEKQQFITFDSPRSVRAKGEWAKSKGLGGLMFWELAQDSTQGDMLHTVFSTMYQE